MSSYEDFEKEMANIQALSSTLRALSAFNLSLLDHRTQVMNLARATQISSLIGVTSGTLAWLLSLNPVITFCWLIMGAGFSFAGQSIRHQQKLKKNLSAERARRFDEFIGALPLQNVVHLKDQKEWSEWRSAQDPELLEVFDQLERDGGDLTIGEALDVGRNL